MAWVGCNAAVGVCARLGMVRERRRSGVSSELSYMSITPLFSSFLRAVVLIVALCCLAGGVQLP